MRYGGLSFGKAGKVSSVEVHCVEVCCVMAGLVSRGELRCFWWVMFWCGRHGALSLILFWQKQGLSNYGEVLKGLVG
jgi:hypothetical protein